MVPRILPRMSRQRRPFQNWWVRIRNYKRLIRTHRKSRWITRVLVNFSPRTYRLAEHETRVWIFSVWILNRKSKVLIQWYRLYKVFPIGLSTHHPKKYYRVSRDTKRVENTEQRAQNYARMRFAESWRISTKSKWAVSAILRLSPFQRLEKGLG